MTTSLKHSKNRNAVTARPSGTIARWITSPFFSPKPTITVGNHLYRFSSSSHGEDTEEFRQELRKSVAKKKRVAASEGRVLIARYMHHGSHYGVVIYTKDTRTTQLRPPHTENQWIKGLYDKMRRNRRKGNIRRQS